MGWKRYLKTLTKNWPSFSTIGEINVHGVIVDYQGMQQNPLFEDAFLRAIHGPVHPSSEFIPVKQFYEDVSRGRLCFRGVTVERFVMPGCQVDVDTAYEAFFRRVCENGHSFAPRTHFMFAFHKSGASAPHKNYVLHFDASMPNKSTIIHEFGHNLGLMHATTVDSDRGDESDRMGAKTGYMEFNAPNLIYLQWLDESSVQLLEDSGDFALTPLEYSNTADTLPKVLTIPISDCNYLYLSMRDRIGPYDSQYLDGGYVRRMSIHTRTLDKHGRPKKTCLLRVLSEGECARVNDPALLQNYKEIEVSDLRHENGELRFHIQMRDS